MTGTEVTTSSIELPEVTVEGGLTQEVDAISHVFSKLPSEWTEADMVRMVEKLRGMRKNFLEEEAKPKAPKKEKKPPRTDLKGLSGSQLLLALGAKKS